MIKKSKADINKNGKIEGWEVARSKAIQKSMSKKKYEDYSSRGLKSMSKKKPAQKVIKASKGTHVTKEGKTAKKGLWYNIAMKKKRGEKMRKKGAKGAPTAAAIKNSQA
tara:strand:- start:312 stop:638 length:327 start_codon:yes stop_codon:yes gene_type:complete